MVGFPGPPDHSAIPPPHPTLTSHICCILLWRGGREEVGARPEELILNAEVAPEDPGDLQGVRERKGRPFLGSSTGAVQSLTPGVAGDGGLWTPREPAALSP